MSDGTLLVKEVSEIKPLNTYCVIERLDDPDAEQKTQGGIIISPTTTGYNKERLLQGKILSISPQCKTKELKVGDIVLYDKHASIAVDKSLRRLVREEDIYAIITNG